MSDVLSDFVAKKEAESSFVSLKKSGDSIHIEKVLNIESVQKPGFNAGEMKDVIRLTVLVKTIDGLKEKFFDNGTRKFVEALQEQNIKVGSSFDLIRNGEGTDTRYVLANVKYEEPVTPESATAVMGGEGKPEAPAK